jgi:glycosyltransferase involved in cell wall biosynthesis
MNPPVFRRPTVGVLIRFGDSASTLPGVMEALKRQTLQPDRILGIDSGSRDASREILQRHGADLVDWTKPYGHSRVLNFGLQQLETDLVLVLSSHTVLTSCDSLERMVNAMADPRAACVSLKWDADPYYSDRVDWAELRTKGLRFGSIYSNSMGMLRRSCWREIPFDETLPTAEDYAWAVAQLRAGRLCHRLDLDFSYQRSGLARDGAFARVTFRLARRHGLRVTWLGVAGTIRHLVSAVSGRSRWQEHRPALARLGAWACRGGGLPGASKMSQAK